MSSVPLRSLLVVPLIALIVDVGTSTVIAQPTPAGHSFQLELTSGVTGYRGDLSDFNSDKPFLGYPYFQARLGLNLSPAWGLGLGTAGGSFPRSGSPGLRYPLQWQNATEPAPVASSSKRYLAELTVEWRAALLEGPVTPFVRLGGHVVWGSSPNAYTSVHEMGGGPSASTGAAFSLSPRWSIVLEGTVRSTFPDDALDGYVDPSRSAAPRRFDLSGALTGGIRYRLGRLLGSGPRGTGSPPTPDPTSISDLDPSVSAPTAFGDTLSAGTSALRVNYIQEMTCQQVRRRAEELYRSENFPAARDTVRYCLQTNGVSTFGTVRALRLTALSYLAEGELARAQESVAEILRILPSYRADRVRDIPDYVDLVARVRSMRRAFRQSSSDTSESIP